MGVTISMGSAKKGGNDGFVLVGTIMGSLGDPGGTFHRGHSLLKTHPTQEGRLPTPKPPLRRAP